MTETHTETLKSATQAHQAGDWVQAARLYTDLLTQAPQMSGALHGFGKLCQDVGKHDDARVLFQRAITHGHAQDEPQYRLDLASSYLDDGQAAEALAECELVRAGGRPTATVYLTQGRAFQQLGDTDQAGRCYADGVDQFPDDLPLRSALAQWHFDRQNYEAAAENDEFILEADGKYAESLVRLTKLMLTEQVEIGDYWINQLRVALTYAHGERDRQALKQSLADCHTARGEAEHAAAIQRQVRR